MTPVETILQLAFIYFGVTALSGVFFHQTKIYAVSESVFTGALASVGIIASYTSLKASCFDVLATDALVIIPLLIGLLAFTRMTPYRWAARYPTALLSGIGVGVTFGLTLRANILAGASSTAADLAAGKPDVLSSIIVLVGMIAVIAYFLFGVRYSNIFRTGPLRYVSILGGLFLMASFGYLRGSYGMSSLASFVLRIYRAIALLFGVTV